MAQVTGQDLIDLAKADLAGYANATDKSKLLMFVNAGKDEVWALLKSLEDDWFVMSGTLNLVSTTREYSLAADFRAMKFIECLTSGYEMTKFTGKKLTDPSFRLARMGATADGAASPGAVPKLEYYYALVGPNQTDQTGSTTFMLADYPEVSLTLKYWYIQYIEDLDFNDVLDGELTPFSKKIATYAAKRVMLAQQDPAQFEEWKKEWRDDVLSILTSAGPRQDADAEYVQDFMG